MGSVGLGTVETGYCHVRLTTAHSTVRRWCLWRVAARTLRLSRCYLQIPLLVDSLGISMAKARQWEDRAGHGGKRRRDALSCGHLVTGRVVSWDTLSCTKLVCRVSSQASTASACVWWLAGRHIRRACLVMPSFSRGALVASRAVSASD